MEGVGICDLLNTHTLTVPRQKMVYKKHSKNSYTKFYKLHLSTQQTLLVVALVCQGRRIGRQRKAGGAAVNITIHPLFSCFMTTEV